MKNPTDQDLCSLRIRVVEACANDLTFLSEIGPRVNRALHDAGIQWAIDALRAEALREAGYIESSALGDAANVLERLAKEGT